MLSAKAGDAIAFATLARRYGARVLAYCARFTRSFAIAEELAQETWLGLWSNRTTYEPISRFVVFLFTAARNRCRTFHRGRERATAALGHPSTRDIDTLIGVVPTGLDEILVRERRTRLSAHIDELSESLREALVLRVVDELPYVDVGAILEIPEATARSRVRLAVQKLRELGAKEVA